MIQYYFKFVSEYGYIDWDQDEYVVWYELIICQ